MHWEAKTFVWLTLLQYYLCCCDLEQNLHYLWGIPSTLLISLSSGAQYFLAILFLLFTFALDWFERHTSCFYSVND